MKLNIDGGLVEIKFTFASIALFHKKFKNKDEKNKDIELSDDDMYDLMIVKMAQNDVETLVNIIWAGLAYMKQVPEYGVVFDAVSDALLEDDDLFKKVIAEMNAAGFLRLAIRNWKKSNKGLIESIQALIEEVKKNAPAKNASKENKDDYQQTMGETTLQLEYYKSLRVEFAELEGDTEITSSTPEQKQE